MFRQTFNIFRKVAQQCNGNKKLWLGAPVCAAAAVALTQKELNQQPLWYQTAVRKLAFAIKHSSRKGYIDDVILLENLREKLLPYSDSPNPEILWRYSRILLEIATWTSSADKNRINTFIEAERIGKRAVESENESHPCAEVHKWYGIILLKLAEMRSEKKLPEARQHLEKAVEIDATDARSWQYLGLVQYMMKDYKAALESHLKAEEIQPNFSNENALWLGKARFALGQKKLACADLLKAKSIQPHYRSESKIEVQAKEMLLKQCRMKPHQIPDAHPPY